VRLLRISRILTISIFFDPGTKVFTSKPPFICGEAMEKRDFVTGSNREAVGERFDRITGEYFNGNNTSSILLY